ncbi:hypothetical protein C8J47_0833 [Sphingomonas sp. PP-F2F-G114-C0414]|uniref:hypothetical protein n=1 Tax=Sphingomonas sp. PP-F2F-G114-C0414 TaxID=2135662 RepID=UPI000EF90646|nr:hypothetical protein [Sphingomonas sp. PP-F2F-G114-C0414]RMB37245.1 hypothetical protein C8J47_0833 [Sphingomonas sp. PP-F2F-G114-C0414]
MTEPILGLAARASARLRLLSAKVVDRRPLGADSIDFELAWLADPDALKALDVDLGNMVDRDSRVIYQFVARDPTSYADLRDAFGARPMENSKGKTLRYSRMMAPADPCALYVGSSASFRSRIGQHLGRIGGAGTYSMRLALWATAVPATIGLRLWPYDPDINPIELEALEQELWDSCTPLLGKRSGR